MRQGWLFAILVLLVAMQTYLMYKRYKREAS